MWIPYTDSVVVVTNNPVKEVSQTTEAELHLVKALKSKAAARDTARKYTDIKKKSPSCLAFSSTVTPLHKTSKIGSGHVLQGTTPPKVDSAYSEEERREPFRELLRGALPDQDAAINEEVASLSGTQLRDRLIAHKPLDRDWIAQVNQVDAAIPDLV